ncbi:Spherulin-4 [Actinoplanes sp. SE50]|uniref:Spherulin-4 n=1 Tax=unclassified Actinoplanes TaxID=2626549 RepID=UPI00023EBE45|nr:MULTISPECIES: Spherulin-4 [unclassified Actinoplanes]AEV81253.1 Spherulin-4 [Actinoplanes sp. SE50/110]ATO79656.1 Spherulin-4 [Actinoplanes sp. SE50]SLL97059.1 Spherulin-4 [Actinoplanes sp. SE50/110]
MSALVVPAYFHPAVAGDDWRALAAHGSSVRAVVLNSADGPGPAPERELTAAAVATGRPLLGYVDTDYGRRSPTAVHADVDRWHRWYPTAGLFLDRVCSQPELLPWYTELVEGIRRRTRGTVVFNHGAHPHPGYAVLADVLVTFEGPYAAYENLVAPDWARQLPPDRLWHLVYDTPEELLPLALDRAAAAGAGGVYVTDRAGANPWDGLPAYLAAEAEAWCR